MSLSILNYQYQNIHNFLLAQHRGTPTILFSPQTRNLQRRYRHAETSRSRTQNGALILAHGAGNSVLGWNTRSRTMYVRSTCSRKRFQRSIARLRLWYAPLVCAYVQEEEDAILDPDRSIDRSIHAEQPLYLLAEFQSVNLRHDSRVTVLRKTWLEEAWCLHGPRP